MKINGFIILTASLILLGGSIWFLVDTIHLKEIVQLLIIHSLIGFFVAFIFLLMLLRFFRPLIVLSPYICKRENKYIFKMVNKSIYHAFDCKFELFIMEPIHHTGARSNISITPILLKTSNLTLLPRNRKKDHPKDPYSQFAHIFFTEHDLAAHFNNGNTYLELHVNARHGLTGLADTFKQQFASLEVIKENCKFSFGNRLDTIPKKQAF